KLAGKYPLVATQLHHNIDSAERQVYREGTLAEYLAHPEFVHGSVEEPKKSLFQPQEQPFPGYRWGMCIDLTACIGCNSCILACQSENNIPVVGKAEVANHRDMQWIRVDAYFSGEPDHPRISYQ